MSGDARTLPLRDAPAMRGRVGPGGVLSARARTIVRAERETWLGAMACAELRELHAAAVDLG